MKITNHVIGSLACLLVMLASAASAQNKGEQNEITLSVDGFSSALLTAEVGAENNINIGSVSSGGGAGKATFNELVVTKRPDSTTPEWFIALATGHKYDLATITQGNTTFAFKLVMVQDYESSLASGREGEQVETWSFQFGAMCVIVGGSERCWSRVLNEEVFQVEE